MEDKGHFIANVEYKECRSAILNFDKILTDLRIKGITLILAFSGVAALTGQKVLVLKLESIIINAAIVIQLVTLVLIYSVYKLDKMYTMFLVVAVDRARAIEQKFSEKLPLECTDDQFPLTKTIREAYEGKFKTISEGHLRLYKILAILSIMLTIFYYLAEVVG